MTNGLLNSLDKLLSTKEASEYLGVADKSLANSRYTDTGMQIPYVKLGSKTVRYRQSDLDTYIRHHTFKHTGETAKEEL